LLQHGEPIYLDRVTGADGSATLRVRLKDEAVPGIGEEREVEGKLEPAVDVRSVFSPLTGFIQELVIAPDVEFPFSIKWHQPRGVRFQARFTWQQWTPAMPDGSGNYTPPTPLLKHWDNLFLRNCEENPWDTPWALALQREYVPNGPAPGPDEYGPWEILDSNPLNPPMAIDHTGGRYTVQVLSTTPPSVRIVSRSYDDLTTDGSEPYPAGGPQYFETVTAPIEEDTDCPSD
jgi:hypothetical protein